MHADVDQSCAPDFRAALLPPVYAEDHKCFLKSCELALSDRMIEECLRDRARPLRKEERLL
jgi:hypothetical protein